MQPLISIIIPVYNTTKEYIQECLNSIINQTYPNWECIFVDNGSSLDYSDLLTDKRIMYTRIEDNVGIFLAYKHGFKNSKGQFLIHCDSDDWLHKEYLQQFVSHMNPKYDTYFMGTISVFESGYQEKAIWANKGLKDYTDLEWFDALCSRKQSSWALWGKILQRDIVDKVYTTLNVQENIVLAYDCLFIVTYSTLVHFVKNIPFDGFYYRIHNQSASRSDITKDKLQNVLKDDKLVFQYLDSFLEYNNIDKVRLSKIKAESGKNFINAFYTYKKNNELYTLFSPEVYNVYGVELVAPKRNVVSRLLPKYSIQYRFFRFLIIKLYRIIKH